MDHAAPAHRDGRLLHGGMHRRNAMGQDGAAHHEHGRGAPHRQGRHQVGRRAHDPLAQPRRRLRPLLAQVQAQVIQLDDAGHQPVDAHRHGHGIDRQHQHLAR
ncbi:hypothetical protein G6F68_020097 [Rhizopus microsporus]|nr:hypothetical protein G6F68_020097 [Rhizopus microsporus]